MTIDINTAIDWMYARKGQVSYSMTSRDGDDSYDCSSAVYYAYRSAGAASAGWAVNTEYEHAWLIANGFELISENTPFTAQRGDVFIWGQKGYSSGAGGHTGIFIDGDNIIHCNYPYDGISVNDHDERWAYAGKPYYYVYRLTNPDANPAPVKKGWQEDSKGFWWARGNGTYPAGRFEYIEDNHSWFYFDEEGYMYSERFEDWYYLDPNNGDMQSDLFIRYNDGWYKLLPDGRLDTKPAFTVEPDGKITTDTENTRK